MKYLLFYLLLASTCCALAGAHAGELIPVAQCNNNGGANESVPKITTPSENTKFINLPHTFANILSYYYIDKYNMLLAPRGWVCDIDAGGSGRDGASVYPNANGEVGRINLENTHLWGAIGNEETMLIWDKRLGFRNTKSELEVIKIGDLSPEEIKNFRHAFRKIKSYPNKLLKYRGNRVVEFATPPGAERVTPGSIEGSPLIPYRVIGFVDACYNDGMSVFEVELPTFPTGLAEAIVEWTVAQTLPKNLRCKGNRLP